MIRYNGRSREWFRRVHGPTWLVAIVIYGGFFALTRHHDAIPLPLLVVLGGAVIAWQGSLQHETIHGHPGSRVAAYALGAPPLSLYLPYEIYRDSHRRHHATTALTDPMHDPESPFRTKEQWRSLGRILRAVAIAERTFVGRVVLGPPAVIARFLAREAHSRAHGRAWFVHTLSVAVVIAWLHHCELPLWKYVIAFIYPGMSLTLLRSLAEHRADARRERRTTVVEAGIVFRLLFLNNNLHVMHHRAPHVPWFALPARWEEARAELVAEHPDLVLSGYLSVMRRHAVRPISGVELP